MLRAEWRLDYPSSTQVSDFLTSEDVAYAMVDSRRNEWLTGRSPIVAVVVLRRGEGNEWVHHESINFAEEA